MNAIADRIGGERGRRMREAVKHSAFADLLDRPMSDAEYAHQLQNAERDLPTVLANLEPVKPEPPGTWGFSN